MSIATGVKVLKDSIVSAGKAIGIYTGTGAVANSSTSGASVSGGSGGGGSGGGASKDSSQSINKGAANSTAYMIKIASNSYFGKPVDINAYLPENLNIQIGSEFSQPFLALAPAQLAEGIGLGGISGMLGTSGTIQAMTMKVWQGSQGFSFSLPMTFINDESPTENMKQIMQLLQLCTPSSPDGPFSLMLAPGPNFGGLDKLKRIASAVGQAAVDAIGGKDGALDNASATIGSVLKEGMTNIITVSIGDYLYFDSVVVENVDLDFQHILGGQQHMGRPWKADVTVTFSTLMNPSIEDLYRIFQIDAPKATS